MLLNKSQVRLYGVTDQRWLKVKSLKEAVEQAILGGTTIIQLREKNLEYEAFKALALEIKEVCQSYQVPFIINDNIDLALEVDADGVHCGQDTDTVYARKKIGEDKILGVTAHNLEEAVKACNEGADYLGVGAIFTTDTKPDTIPLSMEELQKITSTVNVPVVGISGIKKDNIHLLKDSGIDGIAVVSEIFGAENIKETCKALKEEVKKIVLHKMPSAITIAGSDSSGGAGIQADIKTMISNGVFATSAITALTAQNTTGVSAIYEVSPEFIEAQLDSIFTDIRPDAVKIGMVSSSDLINSIAKKLKEYDAKNIIVDPVMVATSGSKLISDEAIDTLKTQLLPLATCITPNIPEAMVLCDFEITNQEEMVKAAEYIAEKYHVSVLLKGGHSINDANDLLYNYGTHSYVWFKGTRIDNDNTHGTGCTLSSAIASNMAKGYTLNESVSRAKAYISDALASMLDLGNGSGPLDHGFIGAEKYRM